MKKMDLVIAGVGGQGNLFASKVVCSYAMSRGYNILSTETIGAAQRGGSVVSHVRVSKGQIHSPLVLEGQADVLLGLEPLEMLRHIERLSPQGQYLLNSHRIPTVMCNMGLDRYPSDEDIDEALERLGAHGHVLAATELACELGNAILTNVVMLGALCRLSRFFDRREVTEILKEMVPEQAIELNLAALDHGYSFIREGADEPER